MNNAMHLESLLSASDRGPGQRLALFALLNLGLVESLSNGLLGASEAVRLFFHAENCHFVRKQLRDKTADEIMSRGVQLADLFEALPAEEAQQEFQRELASIRSLSLKLMGDKRLVA